MKMGMTEPGITFETGVRNDAIPYYRVGENIRIRIDEFRNGRETDYEEFQILEED